MLVTELYDGQGLGNQLWCYTVTRLIALKNGYDFGIMSKHKFKGREFMEIDFGKEVIGGSGPEGGPPDSLPNGIDSYYKERMIVNKQFNCDVSTIDYNILKINDNTKIDGGMQDENYLYGDKDKIISWLKIKDDKKIIEFSNDNICVIHVRGGDFKNSPAIITGKYYNDAINVMKSINENMQFVIVTDDINFTKTILPNIPIVGGSISGIKDSSKANHHIGGPISIDYSILNTAKYSIISCSSFSWWATWTNLVNKFVIAPKYWARHNESNGFWSTGGSLTREWNYLDINGKLFTYDECLLEYNNYKKENNYEY